MTEKIIKRIVITAAIFIAALILWGAVHFFFTSETSVYKAVKWGWNEKMIENEARAAVIDKENARYPKKGDKVMLDGKEVVIIKIYFWSRRYKVRLPDGRFTEILRSELKDKKLLS